MTIGRDFWWHPCYLVRLNVLEAVRENVPKLGHRILDFGCGSKPYEELFAGKDYVGVDIAVSGHSHVNSKIDFFYDGEKLDFPDNSFDSIFTTEVLEHLFRPDPLLREMLRVLRPGGTIFLTTPFLWPEHEKPYDYARYSTFGLKALLEKNGFEQVTVERRGHAFEGICALSLCYAMDKLLFPVRYLSRLTAIGWCTFFNLSAIIGRNILPSWPDLYLNNIALAKKPEARKSDS